MFNDSIPYSAACSTDVTQICWSIYLTTVICTGLHECAFVYKSDSCRGGEIPPCVFEAPRGYSILGGNQRENIREEEEDLLQYAIQQSLIESGSEYDQVWDAVTHLLVNRYTKTQINMKEIQFK